MDDVDLTVGGSLEAHVKGTLSGPTFLCILMKQFKKSRMSDRFWYETPDKNVGFTLGKNFYFTVTNTFKKYSHTKVKMLNFVEQLVEIRKASISRLLCDNGNNIKTMQRWGFMAVSHS